jgi:hypothetical protein
MSFDLGISFSLINLLTEYSGNFSCGSTLGGIVCLSVESNVPVVVVLPA